MSNRSPTSRSGWLDPPDDEPTEEELASREEMEYDRYLDDEEFMKKQEETMR